MRDEIAGIRTRQEVLHKKIYLLYLYKTRMTKYSEIDKVDIEIRHLEEEVKSLEIKSGFFYKTQKLENDINIS